MVDPLCQVLPLDLLLRRLREHVSRNGIDSANLSLHGDGLAHWIVGDMQDFG